MPLVPPISAPTVGLVKGGGEAFKAGKKLIAGRAHFVAVDELEEEPGRAESGAEASSGSVTKADVRAQA